MNKNRRFGGISRLYGSAGYEKICSSNIAIIGVGGVGSWAAEAIARSGVEKISLIDKDYISESNINRQLPALNATLGELKIDVLAERLKQINSDIHITKLDSFIEESNISNIINSDLNWVIDCIDNSRMKALLISYCFKKKISILTVGAAGDRIDPTYIKVSSLISVEGDALLSKTRRHLRKNKVFFKKELLNTPTVWSSEPKQKSSISIREIDSSLNCQGYGSCMPVTASLGLAAAGYVLKKLTHIRT